LIKSPWLRDVSIEITSASNSPRIPTEDEIATAIDRSLQQIDRSLFWVNPDCGLKTRFLYGSLLPPTRVCFGYLMHVFYELYLQVQLEHLLHHL
jgi:hypothetical protein